MSERENGQLPLPKRAVRSRISPDRWEQIKTAYASGLGLREIARSMHVSENSVLSRAHREGWSGQIGTIIFQRSTIIGQLIPPGRIFLQ